jgi:hypothetical protein
MEVCESIDNDETDNGSLGRDDGEEWEGFSSDG